MILLGKEKTTSFPNDDDSVELVKETLPRIALARVVADAKAVEANYVAAKAANEGMQSATAVWSECFG